MLPQKPDEEAESYYNRIELMLVIKREELTSIMGDFNQSWFRR